MHPTVRIAGAVPACETPASMRMALTRMSADAIHIPSAAMALGLGQVVRVCAGSGGASLQCGVFEDARSVTLETGDVFRLDLDPDPGDAHRVCLPHPEVFALLSRGQVLRPRSGKVALTATLVGATFVECEVTQGGVIASAESFEFQALALFGAALTDLTDTSLRTICRAGVDIPTFAVI